MSQVLPYVITRIAGASFQGLSGNMFTALAEAVDAVEQQTRVQNVRRLSICDQLQAFNQSISDPGQRNRIQNIRRNIYNCRTIRPGEWVQAAVILPEVLRLEIIQYFSETEDGLERQKRFNILYRQMLVVARVRLQELAQQSNLMLGLPLSSGSFVRSLGLYKQADPSCLSKNDVQTERTLLKYLGRLHAKTSPFSTFTTVAVGKLSCTEPQYRFEGSAKDYPQHYVTLNNYLLLCFKDVIRKTPELYNQLPIRVNPSIEQHVDQQVESFRYLINFNNEEVIQIIAKNPLIVYVHDLIAQSNDAYTLTSLTEHLQDIVDAPLATLNQVLKELISTGFLELFFAVSGLSNEWSKQLAIILRAFPVETAKGTQLIQGLVQLEQIAHNFARADATVRLDLLNQAYDTCKNLVVAPQPAPVVSTLDSAEKDKEEIVTVAQDKTKKIYQIPSLSGLLFNPTQLYFEDVISPVTMTLNQKAVEEMIDIINYLNGSLYFFRSPETEKDHLTRWFIEHYGTEGSASLLSVYDGYYRHQHKVATSSQDQGRRASVFPERLAQRARWQSMLYAHLSAHHSTPLEEINLDISTLSNFIEGASVIPQPVRGSYSAFVQIYTEPSSGSLAGVLNSTYFGYGKPISRFLPFLQPEITDAISDLNRQHCLSDVFCAENSDGSYFNANMHPPLLAWEIAIPGGNNNQALANCLPIADLRVKHETDSGELTLYSQTHCKRVTVLDLGMQALASRSKLYALLNLFDGLNPSSPFILAHQIHFWLQKQPSYELAPGVRFAPRIVVERKLVLMRRTWLVQATAVPTQKAGVINAEYYLMLNRWRLSLQLPDLVFIRMMASSRIPNQQPKLGKPQFIDFNNPLLLMLLHKMLAGAQGEIRFEEMLPGPDALASIGGEPFVTEHVIQWYAK